MVKTSFKRSLLKFVETHRNCLFERTVINFNPFRSISNHGLTLVELLISTSIVGIIMLGVVSVDSAFRTNEQQQTRGALVSLRTSAVLADITNNARQATGDATNLCIQLAADMTVDLTNFICVYRDIDSVTGSANLTPSDFTDDSWVCYTRRGTNMHKCRMAAAAGPLACTAGDPVIGTVTTDTYATPPAVVNATPDFYFEVTVRNRFNPAVAGQGTYAATFAQDYITNPRVELTARVTPPGCVP